MGGAAACLRLLALLSLLLAIEARRRRLQADDSVQAAVLGSSVARPAGAFVAALYFAEEGWGCTGSLIASNVVATAAHCFYDDDDYFYKPSKVRIGSYDLSKAGGKDFKVKSVIVHPDYADDPNGESDIALIVLASKSKATPIKLAAASAAKKLKDQAAVWAAGYR